MKVLITGSYGQLGNELKRILEKRSDVQAFFIDVDTLDICYYPKMSIRTSNVKLGIINIYFSCFLNN
ncbi:MAG: hypothetical protein FWD66_08870 [Paludibacter sp.]|nr:hypothetical protein [Paludibacter sp.]